MRHDPTNLRRALSRLAAEQGGYFTAAQALSAGYSYPAQHYHVRRGDWQRLDRAIYRIAEWPLEEHGDLIRWTLWSRGHGVISHETALSVHDLGDVMPARVHMTVPSSFRARADGVALHRAVLSASGIEERDGFRVTTPRRTIIDVADANLETDHLARAIEEAVRRGLVSASQLRLEAAARGGAAGRIVAALDHETR